MFQLQQEGTFFKQVSRVAKKLVLVSATSTSITDVGEEALERVPCIHYPVQFRDRDKAPVQALIKSRSEVNAIYPFFAKQLSLLIRPIDVGVQKIDGTILNIYGMVVAAFLIVDKANHVRFFEKTFLVTNVSPEVVLGMLFLILSGADIDFSGQELRWRIYTTKEILLTIRRVKLVGKKEFVAPALDLEHETYVVHVASLSFTLLASLRSPPLNVHLFQRPQISGLITKKAPTKVPAKYLDCGYFFSGLDFRAPQTYRDQQSCHKTGR